MITTVIKRIDQANDLFGAIATAANSIDELLRWTDPSGDTGHNTTGTMRAQLDIKRTLASRMGWLAGVGLEKLQGHANINGSAEHWFVNPLCASKVEG